MKNGGITFDATLGRYAASGKGESHRSMSKEDTGKAKAKLTFTPLQDVAGRGQMTIGQVGWHPSKPVDADLLSEQSNQASEG